MKLPLALALLASAPSLSAAPLPKELRKLPSLEGPWEVVTMHSLGQPTDMYAGARWKIGADSIAIEYPEAIRPNNPAVSNKIGAVDLRASPKNLDYTNYQGLDRKAIFEVEGDRLTLCIPVQTPDRPKELKADGTNLYNTFKRVKE